MELLKNQIKVKLTIKDKSPMKINTTEKIKFKLFPNEDYDKQKEKHEAYIKLGYKLVKQIQTKNGLIEREYSKL